MRLFFLDLIFVQLRHATDFTVSGGFLCVLLFASLLFLAWMRTAFLAGGNAVVRSGFDRCVFAWNGEGSSFCSTVTGLLGRTALGAKKKRPLPRRAGSTFPAFLVEVVGTVLE